MPRGSHARGGLRSHRRRIGKHLVIAPWVIITAVAVLVAAGLTTGYAFLITRGCDGSPVTATVDVDPSIATIIDQQAHDWVNSQPSVDGHCAHITVVTKPSASAAAALAPNWDPRTDGDRPDVWIPSSSLWSQLAASRADAARMLPDRRPSLARSPVVIAMPQPMAKALGPKTVKKLTWNDLATTYAGGHWAQYDHGSWGGFKVAMTNPTVSTAGLAALTAMADANDDGDITGNERQALNNLWHAKSDYQDDVSGITQKLSMADSASSSKALRDVSAFPALEQDVADYNQSAPRVPLTAIYPADGSTAADFPYLTLNWAHAPKVDHAAQHHRDDVAAAFLKHLQKHSAVSAFQHAGLRDPNRHGGADLQPVNGVHRTVPTLPRSVISPDSISQTVSAWTAITRPSNVLLIIDASADMNQPVPGTGKTKLQVVGGAAADAISLFGSKADIGLWAYATDLDGDNDYQQVVSLGGINDNLGGTTRGDKIHTELTGLNAAGQPGLYPTVSAAYSMMRNHYRDNAANQIVVVTGTGQNTSSDATLATLTSKLTRGSDKKHPLPIMTVGYGAQLDLSGLQTISHASGGRTYATTSPTELNTLLLTALFSATPPTPG